MTRSQLDNMVDEFLNKTIKPCENCLRDAKISKDKVDEVLLVGGMTRMPKVQTLV